MDEQEDVALVSHDDHKIEQEYFGRYIPKYATDRHNRVILDNNNKPAYSGKYVATLCFMGIGGAVLGGAFAAFLYKIVGSHAAAAASTALCAASAANNTNSTPSTPRGVNFDCDHVMKLDGNNTPTVDVDSPCTTQVLSTANGQNIQTFHNGQMVSNTIVKHSAAGSSVVFKTVPCTGVVISKNDVHHLSNGRVVQRIAISGRHEPTSKIGKVVTELSNSGKNFVQRRSQSHTNNNCKDVHQRHYLRSVVSPNLPGL